MAEMVRLERSEETLPGVNREALVERSDVENWTKTGAWVVVKQDPKEPEESENNPQDDATDEKPKRRGRPPKNSNIEE